MRVKPLFYSACVAGFLALTGFGGIAALAGAADNRDFHGRDYQSFSSEEKTEWQGGKWVHIWHEGRLAWWWTVSDTWYYYQRPTFPYPRNVATVAVTGNPAPTVEGASSEPSWFYCDKPSGYTPYVGSCDGQWRQVVVAPSALAEE